MRTETSNYTYCEHCGKSFNSASHREQIHHSNHCSQWNLQCGIHRINETESTHEKLLEFYDMIGLEGDKESLQEVESIYYCTLNMMKNGNYENSKPVIKFYEENIDKIKTRYNEIIYNKIRLVEEEANRKIKTLESKLTTI